MILWVNPPWSATWAVWSFIHLQIVAGSFCAVYHKCFSNWRGKKSTDFTDITGSRPGDIAMTKLYGLCPQASWEDSHLDQCRVWRHGWPLGMSLLVLVGLSVVCVWVVYLSASVYTSESASLLIYASMEVNCMFCIVVTLTISFLDSSMKLGGFPSFQKYGQTLKM